MYMKKFYILFLLTVAFCAYMIVSQKADAKGSQSVIINKVLGVPVPEEKMDSLFQISTIDAYSKGYYKSGENALTAAKNYGNFGFGLLKENKGAILFDVKKAYKLQGFQVSQIDINEYIPVSYGIFKYFDSDDRVSLKNISNLKEFAEKLDKKLETINYFTAIKANGRFKSITIQAENNETKTLQNIKGELIGFRIPDFYANTAQSGYTLFFLSDDDLFGGKVIEMNAELISFYIDYSHRMELILPKYKSFKVKDFSLYKPQKEQETIVKDNNLPKDMQAIMNSSKSNEPTPDEMMQMVAPKMTF